MSTLTTTAVERYQPVLTEVEQIDAGRVPGRLPRLDPRGLRAGSAPVHRLVRQHDRRLFDVRRADIECFARDLEDRGRARATVARRLCTIVGFYRYAEEEGLIEHSPAVHVRRPRHRLRVPRRPPGPQRARRHARSPPASASPRDHALVSLLALNGLRVSEAIGADIEALGLERGHRTLTVLRKGGKIVTIPLAPRIARAIDLAIGERRDGPIFLERRRASGWTATPPAGSCAGSPAAPGSPSGSGRTRCATRSSPPPSTPASRCATCKKPPATPTREPRCATTVAASPSTGTPPTSSPPSSPAPPADRQHRVRCAATAHRTRREPHTQGARIDTSASSIPIGVGRSRSGNLGGVENEGESERVRGTDVIEGVVRCRTGGSSLVPAVAVTRRNDGDQPIHDQGT